MEIVSVEIHAIFTLNLISRSLKIMLEYIRLTEKYKVGWKFMEQDIFKTVYVVLYILTVPGEDG